jgi:hypothetical protein
MLKLAAEKALGAHTYLVPVVRSGARPCGGSRRS